MQRAVAQGLWREMTSRTFYASPGAPGEDQYLWAAALHCPQGMLSGQAALNAHGWKGERRGKIDVLIPATRRARSIPKWMRVSRTTAMPRAAKGGIPRARIGPATLDSAAWADSDPEAEFIVISVLQQRLVTPQELTSALQDRPLVKRHAKITTIVDEFDHGITSMNELRFARLCRKYGIREPDRQVWRRDGKGRRRRLDVYWEAEGVVVEIDGIGHTNLATAMDDHYRQNSIVLQGDRIFLRVSTLVLRHEAETFMAQLVEALEQGCAKRAS